MKRDFIHSNCWMLITSEFINKTFNSFHYSKEQYSVFENVAWAVRGAIKDQEAIELVYNENDIDVVFSLGARLDLLINKYTESSQLLEALMATNIAASLLMDGYKMYEGFATEYFGSKAVKYLFYGTKELPLEAMADVVSSFKSINITLTEGYNLIPKQSVMYKLLPSCSNTGICQQCQFYMTDKCDRN